MPDMFDPLAFARGPAMKNRFMLAPLTNCQSHADGRLSDDEYNWLRMRAVGGFGHTMTCAAHVLKSGQGFPGQLGIFSDAHLPGLTRMADAIRAAGSVSSVQLYHGGMRSPAELIGHTPWCPSDNAEFKARAMTVADIEEAIEAFVKAAERAERAGFDGVELHGAHGYLLCQFLSGETNQREDGYGGALENRARPLFEVIRGIRQRCRADFQLGVRLSPERFGMNIPDARAVAARLMREDQIDFLDMSLWDVFAEPEDNALKGRSLMSYFTDLERGRTRLGVAGKIRRPAHVREVLELGADFALLGRAAIVHHNFPQLAARADFDPLELPVTRAHLKSQFLGQAFIDYMAGWPDFVCD
jgi:2,4-dienoyl-CoA reductase-like NADH-dependent reductase (Old Yellow Enzyme family)